MHISQNSSATTPGLSDLRVEALHAESGRCSYVLWCADTLEAALVDPQPDLRRALTSVLEREELKARYVLYTQPRPQQRQAAKTTPYGSLLDGLNLRPTSRTQLQELETPTEYERTPWEELPEVRPTGSRAPSAHTWVTINGARVELLADLPAGALGFPLILTSDLRVAESPKVYSTVRIALGTATIEVLASAGGLAFRAGDRLFIGQSLTPQTAQRSSLRQLLEVPDHTLLYPSEVGAGATIALAGPHRRILDRALLSA